MRGDKVYYLSAFPGKAAEIAGAEATAYWTDGGVLSDDPSHFAIVANNDHYQFTKDSRTVHVNGNPIAGADPRTFPPGRAATSCTETAISFAE